MPSVMNNGAILKGLLEHPTSKSDSCWLPRFGSFVRFLARLGMTVVCGVSIVIQSDSEESHKPILGDPFLIRSRPSVKSQQPQASNG